MKITEEKFFQQKSKLAECKNKEKIVNKKNRIVKKNLREKSSTDRGEFPWNFPR